MLWELRTFIVCKQEVKTPHIRSWANDRIFQIMFSSFLHFSLLCPRVAIIGVKESSKEGRKKSLARVFIQPWNGMKWCNMIPSYEAYYYHLIVSWQACCAPWYMFAVVEHVFAASAAGNREKKGEQSMTISFVRLQKLARRRQLTTEPWGSSKHGEYEDWQEIKLNKKIFGCCQMETNLIQFLLFSRRHANPTDIKVTRLCFWFSILSPNPPTNSQILWISWQ